MRLCTHTLMLVRISVFYCPSPISLYEVFRGWCTAFSHTNPLDRAFQSIHRCHHHDIQSDSVKFTYQFVLKVAWFLSLERLKSTFVVLSLLNNMILLTAKRFFFYNLKWPKVVWPDLGIFCLYICGMKTSHGKRLIKIRTSLKLRIRPFLNPENWWSFVSIENILDAFATLLKKIFFLHQFISDLKKADNCFTAGLHWDVSLWLPRAVTMINLLYSRGTRVFKFHLKTL